MFWRLICPQSEHTKIIHNFPAEKILFPFVFCKRKCWWRTKNGYIIIVLQRSCHFINSGGSTRCLWWKMMSHNDYFFLQAKLHLAHQVTYLNGRLFKEKSITYKSWQTNSKLGQCIILPYEKRTLQLHHILYAITIDANLLCTNKTFIEFRCGDLEIQLSLDAWIVFVYIIILQWNFEKVIIIIYHWHQFWFQCRVFNQII